MRLMDIQRDLGLPPLDMDAAAADLQQHVDAIRTEAARAGGLSVESQLLAFRLVHRIGYKAGVRLASMKEKP